MQQNQSRKRAPSTCWGKSDTWVKGVASISRCIPLRNYRKKWILKTPIVNCQHVASIMQQWLSLGLSNCDADPIFKVHNIFSESELPLSNWSNNVLEIIICFILHAFHGHFTYI